MTIRQTDVGPCPTQRSARETSPTRCQRRRKGPDKNVGVIAQFAFDAVSQTDALCSGASTEGGKAEQKREGFELQSGLSHTMPAVGSDGGPQSMDTQQLGEERLRADRVGHEANPAAARSTGEEARFVDIESRMQGLCGRADADVAGRRVQVHIDQAQKRFSVDAESVLRRVADSGPQRSGPAAVIGHGGSCVAVGVGCRVAVAQHARR